jgi:signal transduction histidine kinase
MNPVISKFIRMIALAAAYFVAGKLGLLLAHVHASISPVWPASGVAIAALLLWGIRFWPAIFIGALLVNLTVPHASMTIRILQASGIGIGNTLEAVVGAWLVIRFANGMKAFRRASDVFRYVLLAGSLATAAGATLGTFTLLSCGLLERQIYGAAWITWWMGDMVGAVLVAPFILIWTTGPAVRFGFNRTAEALVLLISMLVVSALNFSDMFQTGDKHFPLAFLFFPFLAWAAVRFDARGAVAFVAVICCLAVNGTLHGLGTFAVTGPNSSLLMLQMFICVATLSALVLAAAVAERKSAEEQVRKLNFDLEARVQERTAQLEGTNKELEAFCYSVSHDLRAPLRTIRGFSEVLMELYKPQLDARGQDYLRRTCDAGLQMDKLIEDLLKLSRVSRSEIQHADINLSTIAQEIAADLKRADPARTTEFSIAPGIVANGDERLLRLVIDNLLRNAWKFTLKRPETRIEFGRTDGEGSPFFVRDNGVGFDMAYAGKLFGVFQRLHSASEFAGSGVGLAIVQRVINRHGGRVWAEAKVNSGATFYFTLPAAKAFSN